MIEAPSCIGEMIQQCVYAVQVLCNNNSSLAHGKLRTVDYHGLLFFSDEPKSDQLQIAVSFRLLNGFQSYWALGYLPRTETHENDIDNPNF